MEGQDPGELVEDWALVGVRKIGRHLGSWLEGFVDGSVPMCCSQRS